MKEKYFLRVFFALKLDGSNRKNYALYKRDIKPEIDDNLTAKISDFGMSQKMDMVVYESSRRRSSTSTKFAQPLWWMSPECIEKGIHNEKTDVWSFGILMWETLSNGRVPYSNYQWRGETHFVFDLKRGLRPDAILNTPEVVTKLMKLCYAVDPDERLTFQQLNDTFERMLRKSVDDN